METNPESWQTSPDSDSIIFSAKIDKFRDPAVLGKFAEFRFAVCAYETEEAVFGHNDMLVALEFAKHKWGDAYMNFCTIVQNPR